MSEGRVVLNRENVAKVAQVVETALTEGLQGQSISLISIVVGTMTGIAQSLDKKGVKAQDILAVYRAYLNIFEKSVCEPNRSKK